MFCGTYKEEDVTFLLKKTFIESTNVEDKEKNIQKDNAHYSEMITHENPPTETYMNIFHSALSLNKNKFTTHLMVLAKKINIDYNNEIVLVSLARAGTPVGVILARILREHFNRKVVHYTVSIIRDRGLDLNALRFIVENHDSSSIAFIQSKRKTSSFRWRM